MTVRWVSIVTQLNGALAAQVMLALPNALAADSAGLRLFLEDFARTRCPQTVNP
jgi:hypothetical protein